ncbi:hypothetical protein [Candidatus Nitrospira inopinata]|jgi:hypothetical protein|uniref:Uncharacterized protein n=1 Tax=Candidatus Nitrospira inopinata TaxID=1715989 RepID=A0A0S4KXI3_9BACT|nr:hypothetical protein [Candidatus Nitrospira inopinata]CUQ67254.1 protein of unknown function [Candidatus Nitrospira inopinata]
MMAMAEETGGPRGYPNDSTDADELRRLRAHQRAWRAVASCAVRLIPILNEEMASVTRMTERAAMELGAHLQALAATEVSSHQKERAASVSKIVMALQFQDIVGQKLNHVGKALNEWRGHLDDLLDATQGERAADRLADVETIERNLIAMEVRCSDVSALKVADQEPPADRAAPPRATESVTLF